MGAFKLPGQPWQTGKYTDFADADLAQAQEHHIWERRPLDCIPVPNMSAWALSALQLPWQQQHSSTKSARQA